MTRNQATDDIYLDSNGCLTERVSLGAQDVILHYDDIPESDITTVHGLRCTTALRTVIDLAPDTDHVDLKVMVDHCLDHDLFTVEDALARIAQPDMQHRPGARILRGLLPH